MTAPVQNLPHSTPGQPLTALVIGAGFSGVCAAIKLLELNELNFCLVEKSKGIGGTWYDNSYPGAACDVPSHFYCYSFEPNPNWSRVYSPQAEIQQYIEHCADKYQLRPHMHPGVTVKSLVLNENASVWRVNFSDGQQVYARHVINGAGGLHKPMIPEILGAEKFTGTSMHTARWNHSLDLTNKRVAVIGSAASAIQVIPELAKITKQLTVFQRTPNYIVPRGDRKFSDKEKQRFAKWPRMLRFYRWLIYKKMDVLLFPITKQNSRLRKIISAKVIRHLKASIKDTHLQKALEPDYEMGCKRILLSDDLFSTFNQNHVTVETNGIQCIEADGIRTISGQLHESDAIIYATGFDIDGHMRSIKVVGQGGVDLETRWSENQEAYCGACVAGFPNYWMVTGPNTGVGTTSVVFMLEQNIRFIMRMIKAAAPDKLVTVKQEAQDAYNEIIQSALASSVWASGCKSWYLTESSKIITLYPFNANSYRRQMEKIDFNHFNFVSKPVAS